MIAVRYLAQNERISKLGRIGEILVAERLREAKFTDVQDLNERRNFPFADILATRGSDRYLIGVKTRNEFQIGGEKRNESYNLVLINDAKNKMLKGKGTTTDAITSALLDDIRNLASEFDAIPAWATVAIRPLEGIYSAYFGLVSDLGNKRSVPMTLSARSRYMALAEESFDPRITPDLINIRS